MGKLTRGSIDANKWATVGDKAEKSGGGIGLKKKKSSWRNIKNGVEINGERKKNQRERAVIRD
jgi:hypothetical protein